MGRLRPTSQRTGSVALTVGLATAMTLGLTGCAPDARVEPVAEALAAAVSKATPLVIGLRTPDVSSALADAADATTVMVPILVPDLTTATAEVTAETTSTELYWTVEEAAAALAGSGRTAWETWLEANPDAVGYVETQIPVTTGGGQNGDPITVQVDEAALKTFAEPVQAANLRLFVSTAEKLTQWQRTMVAVHAGSFVPEITGLTGTFLGLAKLDSVEPAGDGRFAVTVRHPDAKEAILYQVEQALKSYGTGKIWGKVTKADFEARMAVVELPADFALTATEAVVGVTATGDGEYELSKTLAENLAAQADRYQVAAESGSFTPPVDLDKLRAEAIDGALKELSKRVVAEQKRPGTKLLTGGKSGQSVTIRTGPGDKHVTFFKWNSKKQVVSAFIRSGKTLKLRLPRGSYRLVYSTGTNWYGKKYSFGPTGVYTEFKASATSSKPMKITVQANYTYTVSLGVGSANDPGSVPAGHTDNPYET